MMTGCRLQTHSAAAADRPSHKTLAALCKTTRVQNLKSLFNPKAMLCCTVLAKRCIHSLGSRRLIQCLLWRSSARLVGIQNTAPTCGKAQERGGGGKCTLHRPQVEIGIISSNQGAASDFLFIFHFGRAAMQFHLHLLFLILQAAAAQRETRVVRVDSTCVHRRATALPKELLQIVFPDTISRSAPDCDRKCLRLNLARRPSPTRRP